MSKVLVDTSVLVDFLRSKNKTETWFIRMAVRRNLFYISIITHAELLSGKSVWQKREARRELDDLLSDLQLIELGQNISEHAGSLRAALGIGLLDAIIAATAINHGLPLATFNAKHFQGIKELELYEETA